MRLLTLSLTALCFATLLPGADAQTDNSAFRRALQRVRARNTQEVQPAAASSGIQAKSGEQRVRRARPVKAMRNKTMVDMGNEKKGKGKALRVGAMRRELIKSQGSSLRAAKAARVLHQRQVKAKQHVLEARAVKVTKQRAEAASGAKKVIRRAAPAPSGDRRAAVRPSRQR